MRFSPSGGTFPPQQSRRTVVRGVTTGTARFLIDAAAPAVVVTLAAALAGTAAIACGGGGGGVSNCGYGAARRGACARCVQEYVDICWLRCNRWESVLFGW